MDLPKGLQGKLERGAAALWTLIRVRFFVFFFLKSVCVCVRECLCGFICTICTHVITEA